MKYPRTIAALATIPIFVIGGLIVWSFFLPANGFLDAPDNHPLGGVILVALIFIAFGLFGVGLIGAGLYWLVSKVYNAVLKRLNGGVKPRPKFRSKKRIIEDLRSEAHRLRLERSEESYRRIRAEAEAELWENNYWTLRNERDLD